MASSRRLDTMRPPSLQLNTSLPPPPPPPPPLIHTQQQQQQPPPPPPPIFKSSASDNYEFPKVSPKIICPPSPESSRKKQKGACLDREKFEEVRLSRRSSTPSAFTKKTKQIATKQTEKGTPRSRVRYMEPATPNCGRLVSLSTVEEVCITI